MAGQDDQTAAIGHQTMMSVRDEPSKRYDANWGQSFALAHTMGIKSVTPGLPAEPSGSQVQLAKQYDSQYDVLDLPETP